MQKRAQVGLLALVASLLAGCATPPVVAIKPNYDFSKLGRVALIDPEDYPGQPGTGVAVGQGLEPYLLKAGYDLVERGQVDQLLQEQSFSRSENVDPKTAGRLGKLLGVQALILGRVTSAAQATSSTYVQTVQNTRYQPVYRTIQYTDREGNVHTRQKVANYDVITTNDQVPQTYTTPAQLAFTAKLVDVSTGQVLWTGSVSSDGDSLAAAANKAAERLVQALKKAWPVRP
jgi:hypothetical protein